MSPSASGPLPAPRASMSAFLIAELTIRSVESRSLSCAFIAVFTSSLIWSRSTVDLTAVGFAMALATLPGWFFDGSSVADRRNRRMNGRQDAGRLVGARPDRVLVLADGTVLEGTGFGATGSAVGEVCFNTAMSGYEEILTDPSYAGQIITFTFPHIGNVGTNEEDVETVNMAATPGARGVVLHSAITQPSSYRATRHLDQWLKARGVIGLAGIRHSRAHQLDPQARHAQCGDCAFARRRFDLAAFTERGAGMAGPGRHGPGADGDRGQRFTWDETLQALAWLPAQVMVRLNPRGRQSTTCATRAADPATTGGSGRHGSPGSRRDLAPTTPSGAQADGVSISTCLGDLAATGLYAVPVIRSIIDLPACSTFGI